MSCCGSKRKPADKPIVAQSNVKGSKVDSSRLVKSTRAYGANDFEANNTIDQRDFVATKKVTEFGADRLDRREDYAMEVNNAHQSRLLDKKELLNYALDEPNGVSAIPIINTFHYEHALNHCFLSHERGEEEFKQDSSLKQSRKESNGDYRHSGDRDYRNSSNSNNQQQFRRTDSRHDEF